MNLQSITLALLLVSIELFAQPAPKTKEQVLQHTGSCTSNSSEIIGSQEPSLVKSYLGTGFNKDFIGTFGTTVHECLHAYDTDLADGLDWDDNTYPIAYFVDKDLVIRFAGKRLFKTEELHKNFFSKDVKNLFRYGTYVYANSGPSTASSNQWGFYGLLEEFNAYYHDVRAQIEYYTCGSVKVDPDETFGNSMHAYFEFNIFMANYLKFAEKYHKEDYDYLVNNEELRLAYTLIEYNWRNLLTEIMGDEDLAHRMPGYDEEFRLFDSSLQNIMNDFMIPKSALSDYNKFLASRPSDMKVVEENMDWADQLNLTGFGAGMNAEEMTEMYAGMEDLELDFEEKDPNKFYVVILTTKSEEKLMEAVLLNFPKFKKLGIVMDFSLNFSVYLDKFSSKDKAEKMATEIKKEFPDVKVL